MRNLIGEHREANLGFPLKSWLRGGSHPQPILLIRFIEGKGTSVSDCSVTGVSGTIYNAVWVTGRKNHALQFDGDGDYVDLGDVDEAEGGAYLSCIAWVKIDGLPSGVEGVVAKDQQGKTRIWRIKLTTQGKQDNAVKTDVAEKGVTSATVITDNKYHLIGFVYNGVTIKDVYDGKFDGSTNHTGTVLSGDDILTIGRYYNTSNSFTGIVDEVRIYDVALNERELTRIFKGVL